MVKVVCPECGGAKSSYAVACGDRGCQTGVRACEFCEGEGQVSSEAGERWRAGKAMRDARVKQGLTQEQEAERLGISPIELNDLERGRRSLDDSNVDGVLWMNRTDRPLQKRIRAADAPRTGR